MLLQNWQRGTTWRRSVPGCRLFRMEQKGSLGATLPSLHPPSAKGSAGFQPNASPPQCIRLSKDISGLQKVSQLNFAFCSSFRCPAQQCYLQSRTLWELFGSGRQRSKKDFTIKELLGCAPPPNSGPVSDSSVKGEPNTEHYTPPKPL